MSNIQICCFMAFLQRTGVNAEETVVDQSIGLAHVKLYFLRFYARLSYVAQTNTDFDIFYSSTAEILTKLEEYRFPCLTQFPYCTGKILFSEANVYLLRNPVVNTVSMLLKTVKACFKDRLHKHTLPSDSNSSHPKMCVLCELF